MKRRCVVAAVAALLALASVAPAEEFVQIGKLKVRADSPLMKGEYPRLTITRAQIPAIRARINHPEIQTYLKQARDLIKINKAHTLLLGAGGRDCCTVSRRGATEWTTNCPLSSSRHTRMKGFAR